MLSRASVRSSSLVIPCGSVLSPGCIEYELAGPRSRVLNYLSLARNDEICETSSLLGRPSKGRRQQHVRRRELKLLRLPGRGAANKVNLLRVGSSCSDDPTAGKNKAHALVCLLPGKLQRFREPLHFSSRVQEKLKRRNDEKLIQLAHYYIFRATQSRQRPRLWFRGRSCRIAGGLLGSANHRVS